MGFRSSSRWPLFPHPLHHRRFSRVFPAHRFFTSFRRSFRIGGASINGGTNVEDNPFFIPGATLATLVMLGLLHARHLYEDKKMEEARQKGIELEFQPDAKAAFLRLLPLRSISRAWGFITSVEIPVWLRPYVYRGWARAFHSNLEEVALPLDEYASLQDFFVRTLKEGYRPIDPDPYSLASPVDGIVLRFGELNKPGAMIEQVKGFSYSVSSLLGENSLFPLVALEDVNKKQREQSQMRIDESKRSWWTISWSSPKVRIPNSLRPMKGTFYCVIYLCPGDYHRVHSPVDWHVSHRRHFSGRLFPTNERATRTIRNLYVENERVVLEGRWLEGYMAMAAVGATNVGSIQLSIEPELKTNRPRKSLMHSEPQNEREYEPEGTGVLIKKGEEVAAFKMGSTVVLVFQAPVGTSDVNNGDASGFEFCIKRGSKIKVGEALGRRKS
ncbi:hypothetical protein AMTRI_Chr13g116320 [Amborella trichopoda]